MIAFIIAIGAFVLFQRQSPSPPPESPAPPATGPLANLGSPPDWNELTRFQQTISRATFLKRLNTIYTKDQGWKKWIKVSDTEVSFETMGKPFTLRFSDEDRAPPGSEWTWKKRSDLSPDRKLPLEGLLIALDPGHIGGNFAKIEERRLAYPNSPVIEEGTMTLLTAKHLKPLLEDLGASVSLTRTKTDPVTPLRAKDFPNPKLFYRTAEIRARADLINKTIQPDLVICLHYNASGSATPLPGQHFHIILPGAFHNDELVHEDERFEMLQRLLSGTIGEELPLASNVVEAFKTNTDLPPYRYRPNHPYATNLNDNPFLWARNLLATRLYQCPVIFLEPYVMNSTDFIARIKAGDYEGFKVVDGKSRRSVYREYAHAVADGLAQHYSTAHD